MKHGIAVIITSLSVQVAAEPQWTFMDENLERGGIYDVRAEKVRVVVPDKPFEPRHLASVLTLPLPDGTTVQFDVHPNALLPEPLASATLLSILTVGRLSIGRRIQADLMSPYMVFTVCLPIRGVPFMSIRFRTVSLMPFMNSKMPGGDRMWIR